MIREGATLRSIGQQTGGFHGELMRQTLLGLGLYRVWSDARNKEKNIKAQLVSLLHARTHQLLCDPALSWAEQKAYEYNLSSRHGLGTRAIPHEKLVNLFSLYDAAQKNGEKLSLADLAERSDFSSGPYVGKILSRLRISPMYGNSQFQRISSKKRSSLKQAVRLGYLTLTDLVRLSGLSRPTIESSIHGEVPQKNFIEHFGFNRLSYWKASEIYEAQDAGFSVPEIAELAKTIPEVVEYAEHHRMKIEPRIRDALHLLFPKAKIVRPYHAPGFEEKYA